MDAVVSGRAGVALVLDGEQTFYLRSGAPIDRVPCAPTDFRWLFGDASDLRFLPDITADELAIELETAQDTDTALHLSLALLDSELSDETRAEVAEDLNQILASSAVAARLENVLYAAPLPQDTDAPGALVLAQRAGASRIVDLINGLVSLQPAGGPVRLARSGPPALARHGRLSTC
jgi:hypothetical protein